MTLYKAEVSFWVDIDATDMDAAIVLAKAAVPKYLNGANINDAGLSKSRYGGMNAIKVEAVNKTETKDEP